MKYCRYDLKKTCTEIDCDGCVNHPSYIRGYKDGASDMEKAKNVAIDGLLKQIDKYRWHDLRKDPDDLPQKRDGNEEYLYVVMYGDCEICERKYDCEVLDDSCIHKYYVHFVENGDKNSWYDGYVIAWREMKTFEEESE